MAKFQVKEAEAIQLEELEQRETRRRRTEKMLRTVPRSVQEKKYKGLIGKMTMERFNDNQKREQIMKKIYSYNKNVEVMDPMARGEV